MARLPRYALQDIPQHVYQRGNNGAEIFFADRDHEKFQSCVEAAFKDHQVALHAWVLMPNHFHLLVTPSNTEGLAKAMQAVGRRYVQYINNKYQRSGTLWEGRYRAVPIESERWVLPCMRMIESSPVRNGLVKSAAEYRWSSLASRTPAGSEGLNDHADYLSLGESQERRLAAWQTLIDASQADAEINELMQATQGGWALGGPEFQGQIAALSGRRAKPLPRGGARPGAGRPRKQTTEDALPGAGSSAVATPAVNAAPSLKSTTNDVPDAMNTPATTVAVATPQPASIPEPTATATTKPTPAAATEVASPEKVKPQKAKVDHSVDSADDQLDLFG